KVGDTVVSRQLERALAGVLMARIRRVIDYVHAVHAQHVVGQRELCAMVVVPEGAHLLLRVADPVSTGVPTISVDTGVDIRIKIVLPESNRKPVARETVAL